jgi:hypothetical protein
MTINSNQQQSLHQIQRVQLADLLKAETLYRLFHGYPVLQAEAEYVLATLNMLHGTNYTVENLDIVIQPDITEEEIDTNLDRINQLRMEMSLLDSKTPERSQRYEEMLKRHYWLLERGVTLVFDEEEQIYQAKRDREAM